MLFQLETRVSFKYFVNGCRFDQSLILIVIERKLRLHLKFKFIISNRPEVFCQKGNIEISQNSQEETCARVSL